MIRWEKMDMRFKFASVAAFALVLSACVPPANAPAFTPYAPQPTYGPIANGMLAEAGATNAAATGVAYIATGQAANAIAAQATAEYRATADSLTIAQTQISMHAESDKATSAAAYAATATQEVINTTATARAVQSTQMQQAIMATGTALAYGASVADARAQAEIIQSRADTERAKSVNDAISGLVWGVAIVAIVATLAILSGLTYFSWLYFQRKQQIDAEEYQDKSEARVDQARAKAAEAWANTLRASIMDIDGTKHMLTRRGLVPMLPAPEPFSVDPNMKLESEWRAAAEAYIQSATELGRTGKEQYPFSEPSCVRNELVMHPDTRKLWREGYRRLMGWLVKARIMAKTGDGGKTDWAGGWSLSRFESEFSHTALPEVPYGPVPVAKILGRGWEVGEVEAEIASL